MPEFDTIFILTTIIVFAAAAVSGLAGFGFSIVSVPMLLIVHDPGTVLALNKVLTLGTTWVILLDTWRYISWRRLARLLPFAIAGLFVGVAVLLAVETTTIKLIVGVMVICFAILLLSGRIRLVTERPWMAPVTGFASGISSTSTGMSGPPLVLYFTVIGMGVQAFRATSVTYFLALDAVGFPALISSGIISRSDLILAAVMMPSALLGRWVGSWLVPHVSAARFRRIVLGLLLFTGLVALVDVARTM
ncbi:MAG TPA: sulfite exporter TauE/SafE family protein [Thermomicrobiales bacterium]|nr:sulfite exporter TauE/SafE family protein [Thermomicrobiales bacterium]